MNISELVDELLDVAERLGKHPRDITRDEFESHKNIQACYRRFGPFRYLRHMACNAAGASQDQHDLAGHQYIADNMAYTRRLEQRIGRAQYSAELFISRLEGAMNRWPRPASVYNPPKPMRDSYPRTLVSLVSDTHYGLRVDGHEVPGAHFDWTVASRRTALLVEQMLDWKPQHRDETSLALFLAGDIMEGIIHADTQLGVEAMAFQVWGAAQILISALDRLRSGFGRIQVFCATGNHDRAIHRGHGRASSGKWDSYSTTLYQLLVTAFRTCPDVELQIPRTPYVTTDILGHLFYVTHGDTVTTTGNVGRNINVAKIATQVDSINSSGVLGRPIGVTMVGHVHVPCYTMLGNGSYLVVNGTLSGNSPYAQSIGIHANHPTQVVFEVTPEHPVGDFRIVRLLEADGDQTLDSVIPCPGHQLDRIA